MRKKKLRERLAVKIIAYFITVLAFAMTAVCAAGILYLAEEGFYEQNLDDKKLEAMAELAFVKGKYILECLYENGKTAADSYCEDTNLQYKVAIGALSKSSNYDGKETKYQYVISKASVTGTAVELDANYGYHIDQSFVGDSAGYLDGDWKLYLYVDQNMAYKDDFKRLTDTWDQLIGIRYHLIWLAVLGAVLCIGSFVFQLCCAGRSYEQETVVPTGIAKIPFDLLTVLGAAMLFLLREIFGIRFRHLSLSPQDMAAAILCVIFLFSIVVGYFLILAIQLKSGKWWRNTVISRCLQGVILIWKFMGKGVRILFHNLPVFIRVTAGLLAVLLVESALLIAWGLNERGFIIVWFLEKLILFPVVIYISLLFGKLQRGSEALAEGKLAYKVDTRFMFGAFKEYGENLNSIAEGLNLAVEERMKSERLKTELITNVSHDIKTPLTSIINYAELIAEEPSENRRITEYAEVLQRQSARLKKLIEDLMEASKASTGNLEVHMVPCEVGVLLTQTVGEYEQRLADQGLTLITRQPQEPVRIMADGRLLWRIFDNLLNNIYKYAQSGTRVYLTVEKKDGKVEIAFKNTSHYQLDISSEELTERFVRGDSSRNTEGNGLGLSITKSLTQLQEGELSLTVDGDFFKAVLIFEDLDS